MDYNNENDKCATQVDQGAAYSKVFSNQRLLSTNKLWNRDNCPRILRSNVKLKTFTRELIPVMEEV